MECGGTSDAATIVQIPVGHAIHRGSVRMRVTWQLAIRWQIAISFTADDNESE